MDWSQRGIAPDQAACLCLHLCLRLRWTAFERATGQRGSQMVTLVSAWEPPPYLKQERMQGVGLLSPWAQALQLQKCWKIVLPQVLC